jgi:beta-lactam-binding protein with PASTA domain
MEWMVGESPTDLLSVSTGNSTGEISEYSDRPNVDAKRRLLDLVRKQICIYPFLSSRRAKILNILDNCR